MSSPCFEIAVAIFDKIDMDVSQLVLYTPYQIELNINHKSRENTTKLKNGNKAYFVCPLVNSGVLMLSPIFMVSLIQGFLFQYTDLLDDFKYKVPIISYKNTTMER